MGSTFAFLVAQGLVEERTIPRQKTLALACLTLTGRSILLVRRIQVVGSLAHKDSRSGVGGPTSR